MPTDNNINDLRAALEDMLAGWKYIRSYHGDLPGVDWEQAQQKAEAALAATSLGDQQASEPDLPA